MVDSIAVLPPGWRAFDSNGNLLTDAILAFFDAGTSNARTVYADANLSTSLGTSVNCNSAGYPITSGNAKTLIYTGASAYKVRLTSVLFGGTVFEHDNVRGALDTSSFLTDAAVADRNIVNVSSDRAVTIADKGSLLNVNCSAGAIALTFDDASDCEGLWVGIRHDGTANQVKITGDGTDTFGIPGGNVTGFSLGSRGQTAWISCDGASFKVEGEVPPLLNAQGIIRAVSLASTPPGSPSPGDRHIVGSSPTGAWSGFAANDIAEATGFGGWFKYTPPANSGWLAYVQAIDAFRAFKTAGWVSPGKFSIQVFTSSGTWTKPSGITHVLAFVTGGGGGGGRTAASQSTGGAGAGGTAIELIDVSSASITSETVTVGSGGAGATSSGAGSGGGNSSFGAYCTGNGAAGQDAGLSGGDGGTATGGSINLSGGGGSGGGETSPHAGGVGGSSFWGGGGRSVRNAAGGNAAAYGSGGGGGGGTNQNGGNGAGGVVVVLEFAM